MFYLFKPIPESDVDLSKYIPFIKNEWFRRNFMKFAYALQVLLVIVSILLGVWKFSNWIIKIIIFCIVFICHELLHILVVCKIGDISLTHSGMFFWLNSNAIMSKKRFWLFMTLPLIVLSVIPSLLLLVVEGCVFEMLMYIAWVNMIIAGADIINSVLIMVKPSKAKFYRGYYWIEANPCQI